MEGRRFKIVFKLLVSSLLGLAASQALASPITLDFDGIDPDEGTISDQGYAGFQWDKHWVLGDSSMSGYQNSASSGDQFLYNSEAMSSDLSVARSDPFDFLGASFATTSISSKRTFSVTVTAFNQAGDQFWQSASLGVSSGHTRFNFLVENVYSLEIDSYGGIFTLDDFTYRDIEVKVNEAGGLILLSIGLFGLWAARRRTQG